MSWRGELPTHVDTVACIPRVNVQFSAGELFTLCVIDCYIQYSSATGFDILKTDTSDLHLCQPWDIKAATVLPIRRRV